MNKSVIIASVVLSFSFAGLADSSFPFSPAGASWTGDNGCYQFDADENWTPHATADNELYIVDKTLSLYLTNDLSIVKLRGRGTHTYNTMIGIDLAGHTLTSTGSFRLWNQDMIISNGTWNAAGITMGESAVPRAHLTLTNVTLNLSVKSLGIGFSGNSLTLIDSSLQTPNSWDDGITSAPDGSLILHNSSIVTNLENHHTSAVKIYSRNFNVLVDGERSDFHSGYIKFLAGAIASRISVRDGVSSNTYPQNYSEVEFTDGATNNLVTVGPMKSAFYRTLLNFNAGSFGNRLVVEPGGAMGFSSASPSTSNNGPISGENNRIEVTNGTFTINVLYTGTDTTSASNAVALIGDDATFTVARNFVVGNKDNPAPPRFEFKPGPLGFNGVAPFRSTGNNGYTKAISNMVVSVDATEYVGKKVGTFKLPLMKFSYAPQRLEVDELNAKLESVPEGGKLAYDTTDKTLYWKCHQGGLIIILR